MTSEEILTLKSKVKLNCSICEKCCEYRGNIKITPINVLQISKFLKIPIDDFLEKYTERVECSPEIVIKGIGEKRVCILNDNETNKCTIQKVKPMQCVVFPLVPFDIENDLFINSNQCPVDSKTTTTVNKWLNGNHNLYKKNKYMHLKWIEFIDEIKPKWENFSEEKQDSIMNVLYKKYDIKGNFEKQLSENLQEARRIYLLG